MIAHSLYKGILENVEKQISNAFLVESALEIVIILSLNGTIRSSNGWYERRESNFIIAQ